MFSYIHILAAIFIALTAGWSWQASGGPVEGEKIPRVEEYQPGPLILNDTPLPLSANKPSEESQHDKLEALTLYSTARAMELREKYAEALKLYQRAFRYDPQSAEIIREIVPLAIHLKRESVAVRYALKSIDLEEDFDVPLLRSLALRLEEAGDWNKSIKLLKRAMAMRADAKTEASEDVLLNMDAGRLLLLVGKPKEAADCYAVVVDVLDHPDKYALSEDIKKTLLDEPGNAYELFGDCFLQAGRFDEARAAFERANKNQPDEGLWKFHLAEINAKSGKPAEALSALEEAIAKNVSTVGMRPYELLAEVLSALDKKEELIPRLEKLRAEDPQKAPLGYSLAAEYLKAERLDKAESLYVSLVEKTPTITGYKSLLEIYRKTKQYDKLLSILGETVEKTGVLDTLGTETLSLAKDNEIMGGLIEAGRKELQAGQGKDSFGKFFALGLLLQDGKQWETAREFFVAAATAQPKQAAEIYMVWGIGLLVGNQSAEAVKVFQQGIDEKVLPEDNPIFYFYLAGALAMEDRVDEALSAAKKAAEMKKDSARFLSRIGWVYYRAKRYEEAVGAYEKLIADFGDNYDSDENREALKEVRLALSNICVLQKKIPEAAERLEEVLDEFPDDAGAMNDLGYLWADENQRLSRSLGMIRKAVEAEPDNAAYRDSLGWVLYRLGRYEEAVVELGKAAEKQQDGLIFDHLGDAYEKFLQSEKALNAWKRGATLCRKEKDEVKAKEIEGKIRKIERELHDTIK
jgi:tetratricopeptide (TPR) repeat protein